MPVLPASLLSPLSSLLSLSRCAPLCSAAVDGPHGALANSSQWRRPEHLTVVFPTLLFFFSPVSSPRSFRRPPLWLLSEDECEGKSRRIDAREKGEELRKSLIQHLLHTWLCYVLLSPGDREACALRHLLLLDSVPGKFFPPDRCFILCAWQRSAFFCLLLPRGGVDMSQWGDGILAEVVCKQVQRRVWLTYGMQQCVPVCKSVCLRAS